MRFLIADGLLAVADGLRAVANGVEGLALNLEARFGLPPYVECGGAPFESFELTEWGWNER